MDHQWIGDVISHVEGELVEHHGALSKDGSDEVRLFTQKLSAFRAISDLSRIVGSDIQELITVSGVALGLARFLRNSIKTVAKSAFDGSIPQHIGHELVDIWGKEQAAHRMVSELLSDGVKTSYPAESQLRARVEATVFQIREILSETAALAAYHGCLGGSGKIIDSLIERLANSAKSTISGSIDKHIGSLVR